MHSGFPALRQNQSMNVRKVFARRTWPAEVSEEIERIQSLWQSCRERHGTGGPFLFGHFCSDAMYAPVVWRFIGYSVPLAPAARAYCDAMLALPRCRNGARRGNRGRNAVAVRDGALKGRSR